MKFTEEHELFRQSLRAFLDKEVQPNLDKWEEDRRIPRAVWKKMGDMGFLGIGFPESYGGSNLDFSYDIVFNEELGRINSGGFIITQQVVQYMSGPYILKYGSE
jgi:alkylation response protein AidB-like acyl-CoA dehydrogenase